MSSYFSTLSASLQEMLSEILDLGDLLHTVSGEYTLMRESGRVVGFTITLQCLLAEQKPMQGKKKQISNVKKDSIRRY